MKNSLAPHPLFLRRHPSQEGFTLTEVALALGIVAFAFVPMLGLLPAGLNASRQAIDTTLEAQIVQQMTGAAVQADYSNLASLASQASYYFDYQGNKTTAGNAIYRAGFAIATNTALPNSGQTAKLATVTICILNIQRHGKDTQTDPVLNSGSSRYVVLIADNGR
jgi:uncharacterized protein (TIGR02598 family)